MKQTLRNLIAAGKTAQAIEELCRLTIHNNELNNRITALSARFQDFERQKLGNLEAPSVLDIKLNQINEALLAVIYELYEAPPSISKYKKNTGNNKSKWLIIGAVMVAVIAILTNLTPVLQFFGYGNAQTPFENNKAFSVVVYTHGQSGKQDIAIMKETKLVADFGGRREVAKVGENGQNTFNEIPSEFRNKRIGIGLQGQEGYILTYKDSSYLLDGNPIYLSVKKKNQEKPFDTRGKGREKELPVPSVEESPKVEYRTYKTCVLDYLDNKLKDISVTCASCDSVFVAKDGEITLKVNKDKKNEITQIYIYKNNEMIWSSGINWSQPQKCIKIEK